MSEGKSLFQVDAFADRAFAGNPAAVCMLEEAADQRWMQRVAKEMNLSETAFLVPRDDGYDLRWFTPLNEVDLCGHATLASAHVLWQEGYLEPQQTESFHTRSGLLPARTSDQGIEMECPAEPAAAVTAPAELWAALGMSVAWVGKNRFDYLIEVETEEAVRHVRPDFERLARLPARGFIVTSISQSDADFVSRFFAPAVGVPEDPVTGSAHCCLGPYWANRLGKSDLTGYQASERGGIVRVRPHDDRVELLGQAITVLRAELIV